ncbi:MAG: metalloregulator ArsR/SmtB family transcription factor [bacterium]|nr:metalloregulator ArsR/SmtB family transcription factor [bacterium]
MITIHTKPEDLLRLRFAYSPLLQASLSYELLIRRPGDVLDGGMRPWVKEAESALRNVDLPYFKAVVLPRHYSADFITPTPAGISLHLEDDLLRLRETPDWLIRKNMLEVIHYSEHSEIRQQFLDYPRESLECLIDEVRLYWRRTLAHHWSNIVSVLEGDVLYHARMMALHGPESLLNQLTPRLTYQAGVLEIDKDHTPPQIDLNGNGLQLVPTIFKRGGVSWQINEDWHPMMIYGSRGAGLWHQAVESADPVDESLWVVLGESRTRILVALMTPTTPGELASRLNFTPGAISQHLAKLNQAGLVESQRSGNRIFYSRSQRGEQLLTLFAE